MRKSTVQAWVDYLNDLFKADRVAMTNLVGSRIHCNTTLANHPTCLIMDTDMGPRMGSIESSIPWFNSGQSRRCSA